MRQAIRERWNVDDQNLVNKIISFEKIRQNIMKINLKETIAIKKSNKNVTSIEFQVNPCESFSG